MRLINNLFNILNEALKLNYKTITLDQVNNIILDILYILQKQGYINSYYIENNNKCTILFNNLEFNKKSFTKIVPMSKSSKKIYVTVTDLKKIRSQDLFNDYLIIKSNLTNKNVAIINIDDAIQMNIGGALICKIIK